MSCAWRHRKGCAHSCGFMLPSSVFIRLQQLSHTQQHSSIRGNQNLAVLPRSCIRHPAQTPPQLHRRLHRAAKVGQATQRQSSSTQGEHISLVQQSLYLGSLPASASSTPPGLFAGKSEEPGPNISRLAFHLQEE